MDIEPSGHGLSLVGEMALAISPLFAFLKSAFYIFITYILIIIFLGNGKGIQPSFGLIWVSDGVFQNGFFGIL